MERETERLMAWYGKHKRRLPWRGEKDPYRVWVSEVMLQQTRVETVLGYYPRFLEAFPDVKRLAEAEEADVLKLWEGLGYYSRARSLREGARQVMAEYGGRLPGSAEELERVRGIGPYTAGAIASIAFGEAVPAVDGNVIRVISRLRNIRESAALPETKRRIAAEAKALLPEDCPGDFNQALMDLGSGVCTPGTPDCGKCPLKGLCGAERAGDPESLPNLPGRKPPREIRWDVLLLYSGDRVWMRRRTERMLQGLWVFPMAEGWREAECLSSEARRLTGLQTGPAAPAGEARHVFTHQVWLMRVWLLPVTGGSPLPPWQPLTVADMQTLAIPTAMKIPAGIARNSLRTVEISVLNQPEGNP